MTRTRVGIFLTLGLSVAFAQIGPQYPPGGGYPPGGNPGRYPPGSNPRYPGGAGGSVPSIPRGKKKTNTEDAIATKELRGILRKFADKELVIEAEDKRILHIKHAPTTKYLEGLKSMNPADLQPGDHLFIEASEDDKGAFYAVRVTFEKGGTPTERTAARQPVGDDVRMSEESPPPSDAQDDRPKMRRADGSGNKSDNKAADKQKAASVPAAKDSPKASAAEPAEAEAPITNATEVRTAERDPDAPKLVRRPPPKKSASTPAPAEVAEARPPATRDRAQAGRAPARPEPEAERERPAVGSPAAAPATQMDQEIDPFIEQARQMATSFVETLPNYMVKQFTTRFYSTGSKTSWTPQDNISTDLVYEEGREHYRNVLLNGKPSKGKVEETGAWSTGEFASVLLDLFSPSTAAAFRRRGTETIVHRPAVVYGFTVDQPNSHWQVMTTGQTYRPAYRGAVWIDKETARVLRIEMQAVKVPKDFPLDAVETATDYDFIRLGSGTFLLPVHSESLTCMRGSNQCSKNIIDFRNYKKFGAESDITFKP